MVWLKISLPAEVANLEYLDRIVLDTLISNSVTEAKKIQFVLHEAIINTIQAGEKVAETHNKLFSIELNITDQVVEANVKDYFGGFVDFDDKLYEVSSIDIFKPSGRGLLLIHHLVDEMKMFSDSEGAFNVNLVFKN